MSGAREQFRLVSMVIVNRSGERFLKQCLTLVFDSNHSNFEAIFGYFDNGSTMEYRNRYLDALE